jgi:hypothetical protein
MQLIRKLLSRSPSRTGRNRLIRGLSTAELVGIIVVIGVLGALGATYISGMVTSANTNTGNQNAVTLSTLANSYVTGGGNQAAAFGNPFNSATALASLNTPPGVTDAAGITYMMTPQIAAANLGNYTATQSDNGIITFTHTPGTAP